jgi:hypothetical protein
MALISSTYLQQIYTDLANHLLKNLSWNDQLSIIFDTPIFYEHPGEQLQAPGSL